jgi:hypothetical protein
MAKKGEVESGCGFMDPRIRIRKIYLRIRNTGSDTKKQ